MTKVAIVGSRDFPDMAAVVKYVNELPRDTQVLSGGARGVDTVAEKAAYDRGLSVQVYPADWATYRKRAGYLRNKLMVEAADHVAAFWDGKSKGTKITIDLCHKLSKGLSIISPKEKS